MGMGEPLDNYEAVVKAIRHIISPDGFGISARRVSLSTVGIVEGIEKLAEEGFKINLVLSLHAPNQEIREKLIPYARKYPLFNLLDAMDHYFHKTGRDLTYEYVLLEGINDSESDAFHLSRLLRGRHASVNLIPYNSIEGSSLQRPTNEAIDMFRQILEEEGIVTTWRYTKGKDIAAACGQLALQESEKKPC
jgi:23S rRNA (adenine2503-C2)-methyltransferase